MSSIDTVSIDEGMGSLTIESLTIEDEDLIRFVSQYEEERRVEIVSEAVILGMRTMQLMDTSQEVEFVERRLGQLEDELTNDVEAFQEDLEDKIGKDGDLQAILEEHIGEDGELERRLEAAFDEDGPFVQRLDDELGEDGERIKRALDPDEEGTPTHRLEQRISKQIQDLREKLVEEETEKELRGRTYLKGGDFEDTVQEILNEVVRQTPNNVEFTGDTRGESGRDVGDFVVSIAETGQNIVVEAKTEKYGTKDIKKEMEEAIQNRDADFGIFVTDTLENLPRTKTGWFHEFPDHNTVVVAMSETDDEELEPGYLRIAYNWARLRAIQTYADVDSGFDPDQLRTEIKEIEESIGRFKTVRGRCTEIRKSREKIEGVLDEIEQDITRRVARIEAELVKAEAE